MDTYHWDVLVTHQWDFVGCFIWDLFEMSWRRTDETSLLRPLETSSRRSNKMSWRLTTETSWRHSIETSLGVSLETLSERLSSCGFESHSSHLNFRFYACFEQGVPWHSGNFRVWIHSEIRTWHDNNIQSQCFCVQMC